jgi:hypothetical protein
MSNNQYNSKLADISLQRQCTDFEFLWSSTSIHTWRWKRTIRQILPISNVRWQTLYYMSRNTQHDLAFVRKKKPTLPHIVYGWISFLRSCMSSVIPYNLHGSMPSLSIEHVFHKPPLFVLNLIFDCSSYSLIVSFWNLFFLAIQNVYILLVDAIAICGASFFLFRWPSVEGNLQWGGPLRATCSGGPLYPLSCSHCTILFYF